MPGLPSPQQRVDTSWPGGSSRGRWVVVVMILIGVAVAMAVFAWWSMQARYFKQQSSPDQARQSAGSVAFDAGEAEAQLVGIQETFNQALLDQGDLAPIASAAKRLVERYPSYASARTLYGQVLLRQGHFEAAYGQLARSLELDGQQAQVHVLAGTVALQLRHYEQAAGHFSNAVGLDPTNALHRVRLAQVYLDTQRYDDARDTLLEAIKVNTDLHQAYALLADVYAQQNKPTLALPQIQKAITLAGGDKRAIAVAYIRKKAAMLRRDNRPEEALLTLQNLSQQEQLNPAVLGDMALCWSMTGDFDRAAELYEDALAADPTDAGLLVAAAQWRLKAGDKQAARRHIAALRQLNPAHPALDELLKQTSN